MHQALGDSRSMLDIGILVPVPIHDARACPERKKDAKHVAGQRVAWIGGVGGEIELLAFNVTLQCCLNLAASALQISVHLLHTPSSTSEV
jgi:hypothetical protein